MRKIQKPAGGEYAPYAIMYIDLVPDDGLVLQHLLSDLQMVKDLISAQPEEKLVTRCAEGEWTIKEILVHVIDAERIFTYRALRIARGDETPLPSFEQDDYVKNGGFSARTLADLVEEFDAVRGASISLFRSFDEAAWGRRGVPASAVKRSRRQG